MATITVEQFGKSLVSGGLLTADELRAWWTAQAADQRPRDADAFANRLAEAGKITNYQSQILLQGKAAALTFGNYLLLSQLGSGASGHVFKARHKSSGRVVAIKVLAAAVAKDEKAVKRFQREVEAAGRLAHPHIVCSVDAGEFNGQHYLVMEYVDGSDLASIVKSGGPMDCKEAVRCILEAGRGLQFAHEQGVIHRDIKPGNLLREKASGTVRLLDLGLVRFDDTGDGLTATQQVMGTVDYMSPEQSVDTKHVDARCDIYSLGASLWYLLTGKKLYEAKGVVERIMLHRSAPIPSLAKERNDALPGLEQVLNRMVAKKAEDRYQKMADVVRALQGVLDGKPVDDGAPAEVLSVVEAVDDEPLAQVAKSTATKSAADVGKKTTAKIKTPTITDEQTAHSPGDFTIDLGVKSATVARPAKAKPSLTESPGAKLFGLDKRLVIGGGAVLAAAVVGVVLWLVLG